MPNSRNNNNNNGNNGKVQQNQPGNSNFLKYLGTDSFGIIMIIRSYALLIFFYDLICLLIRTYFAILISIFRIFVPNKSKKVASETVMVVGASRGVGKEIAVQIAKNGALVICVDINATDNEATVREIRQNGGTAYAFHCDVTVRDHVNSIISTIESNIGTITMLFHCCSVPSPRSLVSQPPPIKKTMDVSVTSYFYLLDAILPMMKRNKKGHIIFLTSVAGISGFHYQLPLSVSQFAIRGLYESIVEELRISKFDEVIKTTLVHIYPFIISEDLENDIRLRVTGLFGTIRADVAAAKILKGVRRNEMEISIPKYFLYFGHILRILPRKVTFMLREFWDTGVDFA